MFDLALSNHLSDHPPFVYVKDAYVAMPELHQSPINGQENCSIGRPTGFMGNYPGNKAT